MEPGLVAHHARQRTGRRRLGPGPQHRLLDPHVRRVGHRRRGRGLPRRFRRARTPHRGRRFRVRALGRRPRRGRHHVHRTQAGRRPPGWSWSGNGGGVEYLDLVTGFDATRLTAWGERLFNGPDGSAGPLTRPASTGGLFDRVPRGRLGHRLRRRRHRPHHRRAADQAAGSSTSTCRTVDSAWNAIVVQDGRHLRATSRSWAENIQAGGAAGFGVNVTGAGAVPASFSLDGVPCAKG
ncbi:cellulose binding domain-containing protein [Streptomyces zaomyceticus]|uniref:cellulose binding domain-containing protein n=1 Tax=Streptomyces zaomyceticus TaxID=68286 RepID=UPI0037AD265B